MTTFDDLPTEIQDIIYFHSGHKWWIRHGPNNRLLSVVRPPRHDKGLARCYNVRIRRNRMSFTLAGTARESV